MGFRWLYHLRVATLDASWPYAPPSLATEGFVHCSFRDAVKGSARLYFPADARLEILRIDPRRLDVALVIADTPRGPMPHVMGAIPESAVVEVLTPFALESAPDAID